MYRRSIGVWDDDNALAPCVRRSQRGTHISQVDSTNNAGAGPASFGWPVTRPESFIGSQNGKLRTVRRGTCSHKERPLAEEGREDSY